MSDEQPKRTFRWDAFDDAVKEEFIIKLIECGGCIFEAATQLGYDRGTIYKHMRKDEEFKKAVEEARETAKPMVVDELMQRVFVGVPEPLYYQGAQVVDVSGRPVFLMKKTDKSLQMLAQALYPEKFRERFEHTGPNGGPMANVHIYIPHNNRGPAPAGAEIEKPKSGDSPETKTS